MWPYSSGQRGAGLIEIMLSTTLGLLVLVYLLNAYDDSKATFRVQDSISRLHENARYATQLINHDLRMAGYRGCVRDNMTVGIKNTLNTPSAFLYDFERPVQGFEGNINGSWTPIHDSSIGPVTAGTDVLVIRGMSEGSFFTREGMSSTSADLKLADNFSPRLLQTGDIVMVSDCLGNAVFQVTNSTASNGNVAHDTGVVIIPPGNATQDLGHRYTAGSQLFKVSTTSYYIRNSGSGSGPALWRKLGTAPAQELIEGVQNMQVQYGLDSDSNLMPDSYVNASNSLNFKNVISVRIALLFRSLETVDTDKDTRSFTLLDRTVGPFNDGRMYQVITNTITLRNKAL